MWTFLLAVAFAADTCLPLGPQVDHAWEQYRDAEVEEAKAILQEAYGSLACQEEVLSTDDLLALYRLDALVSITQDDQKGAVYATLRSVAARHVDGGPPEEYGPTLAELYDTWASRLGAALVEVSVEGGGDVFVDGRQVLPAAPIQVAQGEHVVQVLLPGRPAASEVVDIGEAYVVRTGVAAPEVLPGVAPAPTGDGVQTFVPVPAVPEPVPAYTEPAPAPVPAPVLVPVEPPPPTTRRKRPVWAFGGAALAGGGAAFALGSAMVSERNFLADPYAVGEGRADAITRDAQTIRTFYLLGYGLAGVSAGLLTVGVVGLPAADGPVPMVSLRSRW
jgi:hypothetical protein